jgi:mono/diheme cytochrome c family protein
MKLFFFLSAFSLLLYSCGSSNSAPAAEQPVNAQDLYLTRCAGCHGTDGNLQLSGAKALPASTLKKEEIVSQIKMGKGNMPPFDGRLSDKEIQALADYVFSLRGR